LLEIGLITLEELGHHFSSQELDDGSYNYYYFFELIVFGSCVRFNNEATWKLARGGRSCYQQLENYEEFSGVSMSQQEEKGVL
jgi:hypothetical protein